MTLSNYRRYTNNCIYLSIYVILTWLFFLFYQSGRWLQNINKLVILNICFQQIRALVKVELMSVTEAEKSIGSAAVCRVPACRRCRPRQFRWGWVPPVSFSQPAVEESARRRRSKAAAAQPDGAGARSQAAVGRFTRQPAGLEQQHSSTDGASYTVGPRPGVRAASRAETGTTTETAGSGGGQRQTRAASVCQSRTEPAEHRDQGPRTNADGAQQTTEAAITSDEPSTRSLTLPLLSLTCAFSVLVKRLAGKCISEMA